MEGVKSMMMMMGSRDYMEALEDERRKIQVFSKELPLSLDLVTQAIEACKQQLSGTTTEYNMNNGHMNNHSECSEQTTSTDNGPVLEEFIPIKKRPSSSSHDEDDDDYCDDDDEHHSHHHRNKISKDDNNANKNSDKRKSDWLRSVQLWNNPEQPSSPPPQQQEVNNNKKGAVEVKRSGSGGAFQPFHKDKEERLGGGGGGDLKPPSSSAPAASSNSSKNNNNNKEDKDGQRKQRRCWSQELHKRFLQALQQLGGPDSATPKQIRELMKVDGLTNDEVKSHLQKYRLHTRRPSPPMVHNNANPQTTPFVLVGNIFVQQPEFAAAVATSAPELATTAAPAGIYAPVATHPPPPLLSGSTRRSQLKKASSNHHSHSEEDRTNNHNHSHLQSHSNSPASSSSTHTTTTTSPAY